MTSHKWWNTREPGLSSKTRQQDMPARRRHKSPIGKITRDTEKDRTTVTSHGWTWKWKRWYPRARDATSWGNFARTSLNPRGEAAATSCRQMRFSDSSASGYGCALGLGVATGSPSAESGAEMAPWIGFGLRPWASPHQAVVGPGATRSDPVGFFGVLVRA